MNFEGKREKGIMKLLGVESWEESWEESEVMRCGVELVGDLESSGRERGEKLGTARCGLD